tara:strand:- start:7589 stop:10651 length:3063 start_codon:yes stop_codon:yes gene_type:complete
MTEQFNEFKSLVIQVLNNEFGVHLKEEERIGNAQKVVIDLLDINNAIYVELVPQQKRINFNNLENVLLKQNSIINNIPKQFKPKQVVVFADILDKRVLNDFRLSLNAKLLDVELFIFDREDIDVLASKNLQDKSAKPKPSNYFNEKEKNLLLSVFQNRTLFLGESNFGSNDQIERFYKEGIWRSHNEFDKRTISKEAQKGDLIFLKTSFKELKTSDLSIGGVGVIAKNPVEGETLEVRWNLFTNPVNVPNMDKYYGTFHVVMPEDKDEIINKVLEVVKDLPERIYESSKKLTTRIISEDEIPIDKEETFLISQNIGEEIKNYNIFFLPNSSSTSIGRNGISARVLEILAIERSSIRLDDEYLQRGYQWLIFEHANNPKTYHFCFILTRDDNKNPIDFQSFFRNAIINYTETKTDVIRGFLEPRFFIPLLGAGQAGLNEDRSFEIILILLKEFYSSIFDSSIIRLNLPLDFTNDKILDYRRRLLNFLHLNPHPDFSKSSIEKEKTKDKIPFHLDNVETIDKLNREPVAKSLARLINKDIFDQEGMNHSFMVHLQGEWGSGKSTFLNLIEKHLNTDKRKWAVIKYNAWQNQHITPPWWTFLNQLYLQGIPQLEEISRPRFKLAEKLRRIIWYSGWNKIMSLVISVILLLIVIFNFPIIFKSVTSIANLGDTFTSADFATLILSIGSVVALIFSFSKYLATPFTLKSSKQAEAFTSRASDPMTQIKNHFNHLIDSYNKADREVAVFIDDIDRCNREYTIELLEGIQTLFKDRRVLYIVAGDTKWITSCFENNYAEFSSVAAAQGQNLGELFLEKAFQLSVRMPDVSEESKQAYWKEIIGDTLKIEVTLESEEEITAEKRTEIKQRLVQNYNDNENSAIERSNIEEEYNISGQQATDMAIEALDEDTQDVRHLLMTFHSLISPNPRSIKRLANNYSMYRNTLIAEQTDFKPGHLFRWLLLEDKYPAVVKHFLDSNTFDKLDDFIKDKGSYTTAQSADLKAIIKGRDDMNEEYLTIEELNQILRK